MTLPTRLIKPVRDLNDVVKAARASAPLEFETLQRIINRMRAPSGTCNPATIAALRQTIARLDEMISDLSDTVDDIEGGM